MRCAKNTTRQAPSSIIHYKSNQKPHPWCGFFILYQKFYPSKSTLKICYNKQIFIIIVSSMSLFSYFERKIDPYPSSPMPVMSRGKLLSFLWACTEGARGWIFVRIVLSVLLGVFGSLLFAWAGDVVDWLTIYTPSTLWQRKRTDHHDDFGSVCLVDFCRIFW